MISRRVSDGISKRGEWTCHECGKVCDALVEAMDVLERRHIGPNTGETYGDVERAAAALLDQWEGRTLTRD